MCDVFAILYDSTPIGEVTFIQLRHYYIHITINDLYIDFPPVPGGFGNFLHVYVILYV